MLMTTLSTRVMKRVGWFNDATFTGAEGMRNIYCLHLSPSQQTGMDEAGAKYKKIPNKSQIHVHHRHSWHDLHSNVQTAMMPAWLEAGVAGHGSGGLGVAFSLVR